MILKDDWLSKAGFQDDQPRDESGRWSDSGGGGSISGEERPRGEEVPKGRWELSKATQKGLDQWESSHTRDPVEHGITWIDGKKGKLGEWKGDSTHLKLPPKDIAQMRNLAAKGERVVFSHSHPESNAGSFSLGDIQFAMNNNLTEMRAVSMHAVYRLRPPKEGWGKLQFNALSIDHARIRQEERVKLARDIKEAKRTGIVSEELKWKWGEATHRIMRTLSEDYGFSYRRDALPRKGKWFSDEADKAGFQEDQPRDEHGRWSGDGSSGGGTISDEMRPKPGSFQDIWERSREAVSEYTGMFYHAINRVLRNPKDPGIMGSAARERALGHIAAMDKGFVTKGVYGQTVNADTEVYRGVHYSPHMKATMEGLRPGNIFSDRAYLSTSNHEKIARQFAGDGYLFKLSLAKGVHYLSGSDFENERILDRLSQFKVTQVTKEPNGPKIINAVMIRDGRDRHIGRKSFEDKAGFDPDQPRDESGHWTDSGGGESIETIREDVGRAIRDYSIAEYDGVNSLLRYPDTKLANIRSVTDCIKTLDKAFSIDEAHKTFTRDQILYRGIGSKTVGEQISRMRKGDEFSDKAFISVSRSEKIASGFLNPTGGEQVWPPPKSTDSVLLQVHVPKGTRYLEGRTGEKERILDRGTKFRIDSIKADKGFMRVDCTLVRDGRPVKKDVQWEDKAGFDPDQPRDEQGRWSSEGGGEVSGEQRPLVTSNVREAAEALARGEKVELQQPRQVSTLINRLAAMVKEAEARGEKAPNFNLCNVSVRGTNLFCVESKGIPRVKMPQLGGVPKKGSPADQLPKDDKGKVDLGPAFIKYLQDKGVAVGHGTELASYLRASQNELNGAKVARMVQQFKKGDRRDTAIYVSKDNYVIDGHHRWAAKVGIDVGDNHLGDVNVKVYKLDLDIVSALKEANKFTERMGMPHAKSVSYCDACAAAFEDIEEKAGFDPDQPRDEHGRWGDSGGGTISDEERPSITNTNWEAKDPEAMGKIEAWEKQNVSASFEHGLLYVAGKGQLADWTSDSPTGLYFPPDIRDKVTEAVKNGELVVLTHNHPDPTPFSFADIGASAKLGLAEVRAVTTAGTFRMRPGPNGWPLGINGEKLADLGRAYEEAVHRMRRQLASDSWLRLMSDDAVVTKWRDTFDRMWRELAPAYGMRYSFEKRSGNKSFEAKAGFDPDQPRDEHGRWGESGGGSISDEERPTLSPADKSRISGQARTALLEYTRDSIYINSYLRGSAVFSPETNIKTLDNIRKIDTAFDVEGCHGVFPRDTHLYRGIASESVYEAVKGMKEGDVFSDKAYVSTSTSHDIASRFTEESRLSVVLTLKVPGGTRFLTGTGYEQEFILDRGSQFRVTKISGPQHRLEVEATMVRDGRYATKTAQWQSKAGFQEDQPRDEHGRWSSEGGGSVSDEERPTREGGGNKPPPLEEKVSGPLRDWEDGRCEASVEYVAAWDAETGERMIGFHTGRNEWTDRKPNGVDIPKEDKYALSEFGMDNRLIMSHNHPSASSFSGADILASCFYNVEEFRAVTSFGDIFRVRPPKGGWAEFIRAGSKGFIKDFNALKKERNKEATEYAVKFRQSPEGKKLTHSQQETKLDKQWSDLTHRDMEKICSKYGLQYSREKAAWARWFSAHFKAGFQEDQPRDESGRWSSDGGGEGSISGEERPVMLGRIERECEEARNYYCSEGYEEINSVLRDEDKEGIKEIREIRFLDKAYKTPGIYSTVKKDTTFYRGVTVPPDVREAMVKMVPGDVFSDKAFISISSSQEIASLFLAGKDSIMFQLKIPAGTHYLPGTKRQEQELILDRKSLFRVEKREKYGPTVVIHASMIRDGRTRTTSLKSQTKAGFQEDQPRDEHGRWSGEGGGSIAGDSRPYADQELAREVQQAVNSYVMSSVDINSCLRGTWSTPLPRTIRDIRTLDKAFEAKEMHKVSRGETVYRGIEHIRLYEAFRAMKTGDTFSDKSFLSTSVSSLQAQEFAGGFPESLMLVLKLPAGTRYLLGSGMEAEMILDRGSLFKLTGKTQTDRGLWVRATMIRDGRAKKEEKCLHPRNETTTTSISPMNQVSYTFH